MQAVDDRESRLRKALQVLENEDGRILREDIVKLVTVKTVLDVQEFQEEMFSDKRIHAVNL